MTLYTDSRDNETVENVIMVTFINIPTSYYTRDWSGRTTTATGGLKFTGKLKTTLKPQESSVEVGNLSFHIVDENGSVTSWLETNDRKLANQQVAIKFGATDLAEAEFLTITYFLKDVRQIRSTRGLGDKAAYKFTVSDVFNLLDKSVYEDIEQNDFNLFTAVTPVSTTISLDIGFAGISIPWRNSGFAILIDSEDKTVEVVKYTSISNGSLLGLTREFAGTGVPDKTWNIETTVKQAWIKEGHPLDIMRELITGTEGGLNGPNDLGDGDGIGDLVPNSILDNTDIDSKRDEYSPDLDFLFIGTEKLSSVSDFIFAECLQAAGFYPAYNNEGKFTVMPVYWLPPSINIGNEHDIRIDANSKRNWGARENNLVFKLDHIPGEGDFKTTQELKSQTSIDDFGLSSVREISSSGVRGLGSKRYGMPDLDGDAIAYQVLLYYLLDFSIPAPTFKINAHWKHKDQQVAHGLTLLHPGLRVLGKSTLGTTGTEIFIITAKTVLTNELAKYGHVEYELRHRQDVFDRIAIIARDSQTEDYDSATDEEKAFTYWSNGTTNFADGKSYYGFVTGQDDVI